MTRSDPHHAAGTASPCAACDALGIADAPDAPARIGPVRLAVGLLQAAAAVGSTVLAARLAPDPIGFEPLVLRAD